MGRPREWDRDKVAENLVEWAKKDTSINLNGFCGENLLPPSKITLWAKECDNFRQAYEIAKALLGERRERYLEQERLHVKAYDMNAKVYDHFLKDESRDEKAFESKLKAQENIAASEDDVKRHQETLDQLKALRSDRNIENNNNKPDK